MATLAQEIGWVERAMDTEDMQGASEDQIIARLKQFEVTPVGRVNAYPTVEAFKAFSAMEQVAILKRGSVEVVSLGGLIQLGRMPNGLRCVVVYDWEDCLVDWWYV